MEFDFLIIKEKAKKKELYEQIPLHIELEEIKYKEELEKEEPGCIIMNIL